jgi:ABC-2 type transport system ATP-binding protein
VILSTDTASASHRRVPLKRSSPPSTSYASWTGWAGTEIRGGSQRRYGEETIPGAARVPAPPPNSVSLVRRWFPTPTRSPCIAAIQWDARMSAGCPVPSDRPIRPEMLSVSQLTKRFGRQTAVDSLTFEVRPGEVLGFLGPNGAGKTTTMRMITGFLPPSKGRVTIDGFDLYEHPIEAKRQVGYLPENPPVYPEMSTRRFLEFVAEIKDVPARRRRAAVDRAIERAGLQEVAHKRISTLSKGFRQRVGLAQAIVHDPKLLILDEPTSSLDPKQRVEVRQLIAALRGSQTVIVSTHILAEVNEIADRVFILNRGKVMAVDTPANLAHKLRGHDAVVVQIQPPGAGKVTAAFADAVREVLTAIAGAACADVQQASDTEVRARVESAPGTDLRSDIAAAVTSRGWRLVGLAGETLSLEDVFLELTREDR